MASLLVQYKLIEKVTELAAGPAGGQASSLDCPEILNLSKARLLVYFGTTLQGEVRGCSSYLGQDLQALLASPVEGVGNG